MAKKSDLHASIIVHIFQSHWVTGIDDFEFHRDEMVQAALISGIGRPDNLGNLIYSFKCRGARLQTRPCGSYRRKTLLQYANRS